MALSAASTDADVMAQYENSARYWESAAKAADMEEAIIFILNRFNRMNNIGGQQWTREDLTKILEDVRSKRIALSAGAGGNAVHFTRGRTLSNTGGSRCGGRNDGF